MRKENSGFLPLLLVLLLCLAWASAYWPPGCRAPGRLKPLRRNLRP